MLWINRCLSVICSSEWEIRVINWRKHHIIWNCSFSFVHSPDREALLYQYMAICCMVHIISNMDIINTCICKFGAFFIIGLDSFWEFEQPFACYGYQLQTFKLQTVFLVFRHLIGPTDRCLWQWELERIFLILGTQKYWWATLPQSRLIWPKSLVCGHLAFLPPGGSVTYICFCFHHYDHFNLNSVDLK